MECLIIVKNICSLEVQGRPFVRRIKRDFVKLTLRWPSQRKNIDFSLHKLAPVQWNLM